jgi:hypothetical protein
VEAVAAKKEKEQVEIKRYLDLEKDVLQRVSRLELSHRPSK